MNGWLHEISRIARLAGEDILSVYAEDFSVSAKDDASPLTQADLAAHQRIVSLLPGIDASIPVLSEESASLPWAERKRWNRYWLVDPLDGTREFIKRNGEFTVNIALIENGSPVLGVVYAPVLDFLVAGGRDFGASWQQAENNGRANVSSAASPLRVAASRSHRDGLTQAFLDRIERAETMALGSSLKFCKIATGEIDIYPRFGPTSEWDTAAAQAVLEAAGGGVYTLDGLPLRYNQKDSLLNPHFMAVGDGGIPWQSWL